MSSRRQRISKIGRSLVEFALSQILVTAIGVVVSILLVRKMPKDQYAYYTIANSLLMQILALSDSGLTAGLQAIGGPSHASDYSMGELLRTGVGLRRRMYLLAGILVLPFVPYMLWHAGAPVPVLLEVVFLVIAITQFRLMISIYNVVPRLRGQVRILQWVNLGGVFARLAIIVPAYFSYLSIGVALAALLVADIVQIMMLIRWSRANVDLTAKPSPVVRKSVWRIVRAQIPYEIYGIFQGQISVWLITIFGDAGKIANFGAITRLGIIFTVLPRAVDAVLTPKLSRCTQARRLRGIYWLIFFAFFLCSSASLGIAMIRPDLFLNLLGNKYSNLRSDFFLAMCMSAVWALQGNALGLNMSRGWVVPAYVGITVTLATQAIAFTMVNLSTVRGVLLASMAVGAVNLVVQLVGSEVFIRKAIRKEMALT